MRKKTAAKTLCVLLSIFALGGCAGKDTGAGSQDKSAEPAGEVKEQKDELTEPETVVTEEAEKETEIRETEIETEQIQEAAVPDYEALYEPVFQEAVSVLRDGWDFDRTYEYMSNGIMEIVMYGEGEDLLNRIGYVLMDISGDGVPELMIGEDEDYDGNEQSYILNAFTLKEDKPLCVFDGWARNTWRWLGDGFFLNEGSNGAMSTLFGQAHLNEDGTELIWDDCYFSDENEEGNGMVFYHNTTGAFDPAISEEFDIDAEEFWNILDSYSFELLPWTPIGDRA